MQRRLFLWSGLPAVTALCHFSAHALSLADLSNTQAAQGLRAALERGARAAVSELGRPDGFMGNELVRIALPNYLQDVSSLLHTLGQGDRLDALVATMNQAAEAAVPLAREMLVGAVKSINVQDAKAILTGGETAVTQFFVDRTRNPLSEKFLPIVRRTTARAQLAEQYNQIASKASGLGLLKGEVVSIERYVTSKALDGLYFMIGEEEKKIRRDPVGTGSALLKKVFGALQ
ncbi:MAG: DUF4197 domain-containing protein [Rhodoferax sp.]|nr:DUF4197 domain-containing protein [Rhodoferax sp.]